MLETLISSSSYLEFRRESLENSIDEERVANVPVDRFDRRGQRYQVNGGQDPCSGRVEAIEKRIEIKVDCDRSSRACLAVL